MKVWRRPDRGKDFGMSQKESPVRKLVAATLLRGCIPALVFMMSGCSVPQQFQYERHWVQTHDGWGLALRRFKPSTLSPDRTPVILCHGLGYNGYFWHLPTEPNFAHELQKLGYDVWVVDLRGAGGSTKPGFSIIRNVLRQPLADFPFRIPQVTFNVLQFDWSADDYVKFDLPPVIDYVRARTDHVAVNWVGHSLGGLIMYTYLTQSDPEKINAFVSLCAPTIMPHPLDDGLKFISENGVFFKLGNAVLTSGVNSQMKLASGTIFEGGLDWLFYNRRNVTLTALWGLYYYVAEDIPGGVLQQVIELAKSGQWKSLDGKINYTEKLSKIKTPILIAGGKADNIALPEALRYAYNHVSSEDKTYRLFGRTNAYSIDYGHNDVVIGKRATREVLPYISRWLAKRSSGTRLPADADPMKPPTGGLLERFLHLPKIFERPPGAVEKE